MTPYLSIKIDLIKYVFRSNDNAFLSDHAPQMLVASNDEIRLNIMTWNVLRQCRSGPGYGKFLSHNNGFKVMENETQYRSRLERVEEFICNCASELNMDMICLQEVPSPETRGKIFAQNIVKELRLNKHNYEYSLDCTNLTIYNVDRFSKQGYKALKKEIKTVVELENKNRVQISSLEHKKSRALINIANVHLKGFSVDDQAKILMRAEEISQMLKILNKVPPTRTCADALQGRKNLPFVDRKNSNLTTLKSRKVAVQRTAIETSEMPANPSQAPKMPYQVPHDRPNVVGIVLGDFNHRPKNTDNYEHLHIFGFQETTWLKGNIDGFVLLHDNFTPMEAVPVAPQRISSNK